MKPYTENWSHLFFSPHVWWILALTLLMLGCGVGKNPKRLEMSAEKIPDITGPTPQIPQPDQPPVTGPPRGTASLFLIASNPDGLAMTNQQLQVQAVVGGTKSATEANVTYSSTVRNAVTGAPAPEVTFQEAGKGSGIFQFYTDTPGHYLVAVQATISTPNGTVEDTDTIRIQAANSYPYLFNVTQDSYPVYAGQSARFFVAAATTANVKVENLQVQVTRSNGTPVPEATVLIDPNRADSFTASFPDPMGDVYKLNINADQTATNGMRLRGPATYLVAVGPALAITPLILRQEIFLGEIANVNIVRTIGDFSPLRVHHAWVDTSSQGQAILSVQGQSPVIRIVPQTPGEITIHALVATARSPLASSLLQAPTSCGSPTGPDPFCAVTSFTLNFKTPSAPPANTPTFSVPFSLNRTQGSWDKHTPTIELTGGAPRALDGSIPGEPNTYFRAIPSLDLGQGEHILRYTVTFQGPGTVVEINGPNCVPFSNNNFGGTQFRLCASFTEPGQYTVDLKLTTEDSQGRQRNGIQSFFFSVTPSLKADVVFQAIDSTGNNLANPTAQVIKEVNLNGTSITENVVERARYRVTVNPTNAFVPAFLNSFKIVPPSLGFFREIPNNMNQHQYEVEIDNPHVAQIPLEFGIYDAFHRVESTIMLPSQGIMQAIFNKTPITKTKNEKVVVDNNSRCQLLASTTERAVVHVVPVPSTSMWKLATGSYPIFDIDVPANQSNFLLKEFVAAKKPGRHEKLVPFDCRVIAKVTLGSGVSFSVRIISPAPTPKKGGVESGPIETRNTPLFGGQTFSAPGTP